MLEISLGSTTIQSNGSDHPVMFINVLSNGKLEMIAYDGNCVVGYDCKWQDFEYERQPENELWYAHDWQSLIDIVGAKVALDVSRRVTRNWRYLNNMTNRQAVYGLENMLEMIDKMSMLDSTWSYNFDVGYPFEKPLGDMLLDMFSWQQAVINQEPAMYRRLQMLVDEEKVEFVSEGQLITDPFLDESGRYKVDPIEHYGFSRIYAIAGMNHSK